MQQAQGMRSPNTRGMTAFLADRCHPNMQHNHKPQVRELPGGKPKPERKTKAASGSDGCGKPKDLTVNDGWKLKAFKKCRWDACETRLQTGDDEDTIKSFQSCVGSTDVCDCGIPACAGSSPY